MSSPRIRILPPELSNQIAAGEVVERPASVLKELLENSLDAGATRIRVSIERGGQGLARVADDGIGLMPEEMALAVTRHATSKITEVGDLFRIATFGFRGEALPSIGSVSRLRLASCPRGEAEGAYLDVVFGRTEDSGPLAMAPGTTVEVRDLFANVPARLKFLKSEATETKRCQDVVARLALAYPAIGFSLTLNGRMAFDLPPGQDMPTRLAAFWPAQVVETLLPFRAGTADFRVSGLAGTPDTAQGRADRMLFYVNRRPVQDRLLLSAVRESYAGRLLAREYPQIVLFLDLPPEEVDVNVHPSKQEVRFREESRVFALIRAALRDALDGAVPLAYRHAPDDEATSLAERAGGYRPAVPPSGPGLSERPKFASYDQYRRETARPVPLDLPPARSASRAVTEAPAFRPYPTAPVFPAEQPVDAEHGAPETGGIAYLGQVADTYLVLRLPDGTLGLLDQHAAHERVLFEKMRRLGRSGESRPLAVPLPVPLHVSEAEALETLWPELTALGFGMSREGPTELTLTAVPPSLDGPGGVRALREALDGRAKGLEDLWILLSCKTALKANAPLARAEALSLLEAWLDTEGRDYCPHGRPALVRLGAAELEKLFKRR